MARRRPRARKNAIGRAACSFAALSTLFAATSQASPVATPHDRRAYLPSFGMGYGASTSANATETYVCKPLSACQTCTPDELHNDPACAPYGNKISLSCLYVPADADSTLARKRRRKRDAQGLADESVDGEETESDTSIDGEADEASKAIEQGLLGQVELDRPCARVVAKERADFGEFVLCNVAFALLGLGVLSFRQRSLAAQQYLRSHRRDASEYMRSIK
ncbi:uncharacterized protein L969DRAFT_48607 [Mixia osmundae IAM 14324]|uniref:Uncharacterized protein n=1 Tax=Mixia osmundae (strain CBS 9802 / IAM 14324 / JCM 22182 / KY 12970) TaxID=764103 RepID=G7E3H6_MIXOS|nr:uncharacterized protein L969DRAFT_48607 [Mixia osmundae IAM 14324]KEI39373.1 hypothetical protein L969DRAFT_48607 [Mixia osmundae IAM 14324]GAA97386.1 hypothetical protein E5Q_04064 [Mixia osmundae IAM 14324]